MGIGEINFVLSVVIFFLAVAGIVLWRRQHGFRFYRKQCQAVEKLRESEERFRVIFDNSNDGIIVTEKNTRKFLFGNRTIHLMLGYTPEESMVLEIKNIHPEKNLPAVLEMFEKLVSNDIRLAPNIPVKRKDGSVFYADINTHSLNLGGKIYQVGVFRDVTERKQAGEEVKNIHSNLLNILDSMDALVYVTDMETYELLYMNKFGRDIWGKDYAGKKCWQVIQKEQAVPCAFCTNDKLLKPDGSSSGVYKWEFQNTKNNRWYDCRDSAITWFDGRTVRMEIATDITERKQAEKEIEKLNTALEEKVALRTSQFLNTNLELSKEISVREEYEKQLKTSLLEKELLLKEVNHRVKNNLQTIAGILGLQIMQSKNNEIISRLKNVQEQVNSMALLQGMLHQAENLNEINFEEYINTMVANLSHSHMVRPAELEITVNAPGILLDINTAIPCGLIINELLTNSLRHAFRDKKERKIWLDFNLDRRKDSYVISIRDNGIGLPEDFDSKKATTLGLQLVEGLTKQLNGTVVFQNNGGAQLIIAFPNPKKR